MRAEPTAAQKEAWRRYNENRDRSRFTLAKLENMQYKIDRENVIRYSMMCAQKRPQPSYIRQMLYRARGTRYHPPVEFMEWKSIVKLADWFGVPAEILVDEDYYFGKYGVAGYRIMFEAYRRGVSLDELTRRPEGKFTSSGGMNSWYKAWYNLLKGCWSNDINSKIFSLVLQLCRERLGIPIGTVLGKQVHSCVRPTGVYGELVDIVSALGSRECAFLAGVARAVHDYRVKSVGRAALVGDVDKLLGWYFGDSKEKGTSCASGFGGAGA